MSKHKKENPKPIDFKEQLAKIKREQFDEEPNFEVNAEDRELTKIVGYYTDHIKKIDEEHRRAHAPYNFVPLNQKVIPSDHKDGIPPSDLYHDDLKTGYIDLEIKLMTETFIRDTLTEDESNRLINFDKNISEAKKSGNNSSKNKFEKERLEYLWSLSDFYSPADGVFRLPGSSLRGLTRNMTEIVSFSKLLFFQNDRLYFRGLADRSNLRDEYQNKMGSTYGGSKLNIKSGVLIKTGFHEYNICPSIIDANGRQFYRISFNQGTKIINGTGMPGMKLKEPGFLNVFFDSSSAKGEVLTGLSQISTLGFPDEGYAIASGKFGNKSMHWVINSPDMTKGIPLDYQTSVLEYLNDENRKSEVDLIKEAERNPDGVPCFYIEGTPLSFGHTGMFRLAYENTIKEHIYQESASPDITEAIFGNETAFAGRVFFEDAFCTKSDKTHLTSGAKHPQILSGPKPTTFQHYLVQTSAHIRELKHYNPDNKGKISCIRGFKLYWHRKDASWIQNAGNVTELNQKQYTKINPLKDGVVFKGRLRFENLSKIELGALLFALELPDGCCHKIGMGKPLGLGSIQITPTLFLSDRPNRYKDLFVEWDSEPKPEQIITYKNAFATYILKALKNDSKEHTFDELWENDRLKELKAMLDFNHKPSPPQEYMSLGEFKNRPVLPLPSDVTRE